jgi:TolB-like protein
VFSRPQRRAAAGVIGCKGQIRVYSLQVGVPAQAKPATEAKPAESKKRSSLLPLIAGIVALIVIAAGAWYFLGANRPAQAAHLSIVVLPFTNLSGDPAQDYFADGVTENLTTDLSRIHDSFVIARNTAFAYKGKPIDARQIGKELGVRYVLEGSVQRDQNRVRINAQLIDAESGAHLWAERFEEDVADLFKLQDQVVARLANTLGYELVRAEATKGARSTNPDANDLVMRGLALSNEQSSQPSKEKNDASRALYEQALAIDPNNAAAIAGLAFNYFREYLLDTEIPGPTTTLKYSVRQTERSRSRRITTYRTTRKALTCRRRAVMTRASGSLTPASPSIRTDRVSTLHERPRKYLSAISTRRNPTCNRRFG